MDEKNREAHSKFYNAENRLLLMLQSAEYLKDGGGADNEALFRTLIALCDSLGDVYRDVRTANLLMEA